MLMNAQNLNAMPVRSELRKKLAEAMYRFCCPVVEKGRHDCIDDQRRSLGASQIEADNPRGEPYADV